MRVAHRDRHGLGTAHGEAAPTAVAKLATSELARLDALRTEPTARDGFDWDTGAAGVVADATCGAANGTVSVPEEPGKVKAA